MSHPIRQRTIGRHPCAREVMPSPLIQIVNAALAFASQRSGQHLVCPPGWTQCCHGVFPISHQDAARLPEALAALK